MRLVSVYIRKPAVYFTLIKADLLTGSNEINNTWYNKE